MENTDTDIKDTSKFENRVKTSSSNNYTESFGFIDHDCFYCGLQFLNSQPKIYSTRAVFDSRLKKIEISYKELNFSSMTGINEKTKQLHN